MVPLIELRGAMIYAAVAELPFLPSLVCCVLGNILPVPFLIKFAKTVLVYFSNIPKIGFIFQKIIEHGNKKAKKVNNLELLSLFLFVAIPLPGTGAWTGALVAAMLDMPLKKAFPAILLGVVGAAIIVSFVSYGAASLIFG